MFCEKCGENQPDNSVFCSNCGNNMANGISANTVAPVSVQPKPVMPQPVVPAPAPAPIPAPIPQAVPVQAQRPVPQPVYQQAQPQRPVPQPVYQQAGAPGFDPLTAPLSVGSYMGMFLLMAIPLVNFIMMLIWLFGSTTNKNKKNFAIAMVLFTIIMMVLSFLLSGIIFAILTPLLQDIQYSAY